MDPCRTYGSMYLHAYWQLREDWKQQASHQDEHGVYHTVHAKLTMNGLLMPLQRFLASEALGAKVAGGPLAVALGRRSRRGRRQRRQVNTRVRRTS